ncbi:hypothetical protein GOP47_0005432 [Adiantum capillus-veneris]|uniref:VQ domain-containing protein n=1 Tax=Adiantum capillus-veneris TaxID=13818 RepID=A0A9D4V689_ADICA|nr:hypothetical protein GOP47_0005432 [Adiantum capillus-veneris]
MDYAHHAATDVVAASLTPLDGKKLPSPPFAIADGRTPIVKTTMKEKVVHTTCFNFKDVVQKLTGASGKVEDMLPVTLPNRISSASSVANGSSKSLATSKALDVLSVRMDANKALKKSSSCKLLERRKGVLSKLEQLQTDKPISVSALSPSPITPLTAYFEKFCSAITPTPSPSSNLSSSPSRHSIPEPESSSMSIPINECQSPSSILSGTKTITTQKRASPSQPLCGPPLLSLFPESPNSSPRHLN